MNFSIFPSFQHNLTFQCIAYQQNMALFLTTLNNINQSLLMASTQDNLPFPFRPLSNEFRSQGLLDVVFGKKDLSNSSLEMRQGMLSTSPSSENSKGGMEEESENLVAVNSNFKKPVFTITRQNKLSKRYKN